MTSCATLNLRNSSTTAPPPRRPSSLRGLQHSAPGTRHSALGFTLVELIVASIIITFVASATTMVLSRMLSTRDRSAASLQAFSRAQAAANHIAADAETVIRDANLTFARILINDSGGGSVGPSAATEMDGILLFTRSMRRVRSSTGPYGDQPEGGEYEVQYRVEPTLPSFADRNDAPPSGGTLWRRCDPVPDEIPDGGGVASPIADRIVSLRIEANDGVDWTNAWDSDQSGFPHALRVTVIATDDQGRYTAAARRTISLDRTPLPLVPDTSDSGATPTTNPTTGANNSGTTTPSSTTPSTTPTTPNTGNTRTTPTQPQQPTTTPTRPTTGGNNNTGGGNNAPRGR